MIFCTVCGAQLDDSARFCTSCGTAVESKVAQEYAPQPEQPAYTEPVYTQPVYAQPVPEPAPALDKGALIMSIVALVLASSGLVGLILAIVAKGKVKKLGQPLTGGNKVAGILSTVALIISIIMMVVLGIYFIWLLVVLIGGGAAAISSFDWEEAFAVIASIR